MLDYLKSAKIFNDFCAQISKFTRANFKILKAQKWQILKFTRANFILIQTLLALQRQHRR